MQQDMQQHKPGVMSDITYSVLFNNYMYLNYVNFSTKLNIMHGVILCVHLPIATHGETCITWKYTLPESMSLC